MKQIIFIVILDVSLLFHAFGLTTHQCPAGFYCPKKTSPIRDGDGYVIPVPCPPGTFSGAGQDDCTPCEHGYYANASGSASCTLCPAGYTCLTASQAPVPCPLGTYASCVGQTCCSSCPVGTYTPQAGSKECQKCPAGARCPRSPISICGGDILSLYHRSVITNFTGMINPKWVLLYKATRDGFRSDDFHRLCNKQTQTITIIQSFYGYLFGGYAHVAWNSTNTWRNDPRAFIFTLTNPNSILPRRYLIKGGYEQYALEDSGSEGPTFGSGFDIHVANNSNQNNNSYTNFGHGYTDTTGKGSATFTGNYIFQTRDIEVYKLYE